MGNFAFGWTDPTVDPPGGAGVLAVDADGVGIGTTNPSQKLHVKSSSAQSARFESTNAGGSSQIGIISTVAGGTEWRLGTAIGGASPTTFSIYDQTNGISGLSIESTGKVNLGGGLAINNVPQIGFWNSRIPIANSNTIIDSPVKAPYSSVTIGADGLPIIAYGGDTSGVKVVHCGNISCTSGNIITALDGASGAGKWASIAIGSDALPLVAYVSGTTIKTVKCADAACKTFSGPATPVSSGVGGYLSLIMQAGQPLMAYARSTGPIFLADCNNAACTTATAISLGTPGGVPRPTAIAIGWDGNPVVAYQDPAGSGDVKAVMCSDVDCGGKTTQVIANATGEEGVGLGVTIAADGLPIFSYLKAGTTNKLTVRKCFNKDCTNNGMSNEIAPIDSIIPPATGTRYPITISAEGLPMVLYANIGFVGVLKCGVYDCNDIDAYSLGNVYSAGTDSVATQSLAIGADGLPIITSSTYIFGVPGALRVDHCGSDRCISSWTRN